MSNALADKLRAVIRTVPDWPKPGIEFRDITPLFLQPDLWNEAIEHLAARYRDMQIDAIAGMDARGFIVGSTLAMKLNLPFVPIRKKGKLPAQTIREDYALEYGVDSLEIHTDALKPGARVVLADDLIATGGTLLAGAKLIRRLNALPVEAAVIIALPDLPGLRLCAQNELSVHYLLEFSGH
jgi:adenine phosphoribosyltransferase